MSFSDRRLLIELGTVLVVKIAIIALIKFAYFSPQTEQAPVELHFLRGAPANQVRDAEQPQEITDKER